jgi:HEAT repeat protein
VQLLRAFGGPEALADLEQMTSDAEPAVQRDAARAIIGFVFDESFQVLKRILDTEKHPGRAAVVNELGSTRDQKAAPLFCFLVRNLEPRGTLRATYLESIERLGTLGGAEAVQALVEAMQKGRWWTPFRTREVRTEAAAALAQMRLPAAREALEDLAVNGSLGVRSIAKKFVRAT